MLAKERKNRRCSHCRYIGHTRRQCLVLRASVQPSPGKHCEEPREQSRVIPVQTYLDRPQSPHVVALESEASTAVDWDAVPVYREQLPKPAPARVVVDFASIVKHAGAPAEVRTRPRSRQWLLTGKSQVDRLSAALQDRFAVFHFKKALPAAVSVALIAALPFPAASYYQKVKQDTSAVVAASAEGFLALRSSTAAAFAADLPKASAGLAAALQSFSEAERILAGDRKMLASFLSVLPVVGEHVSSRLALLEAGGHVALGNTYLMKGIERSASDPALTATDRIGIIRDHLKAALPQYRAALSALSAIDSQTIPVEYQAQFQEFKVLFAAVVDDFEDVVALGNAFQTVFGGDSFRRYLLVFQNHHELRPTGGFMGSFAILDVQKGKIQHIEIPSGGTYDLQGQLGEYVKPPIPLQLVNSRFEFQDANWFPDFAASAEKMRWFYAHSRGRTVDGVIAVNASVLERLLGILGPIDADKYDLVLQSDSVLSQIETVIEHGQDAAGAGPKAILSDLLGEVVDLTSQVKPVDGLRLLTELYAALSQKEIQVYFADSVAQEAFRQYGWTGELVSSSDGRDYLAVSIANLQGQKSDAVVDTSISHQAVVAEDGTVENTVVIRRTHRGGGIPMYDVANIGYIRVYVPPGAELIDAGGFTYPPEAAFHVPETWYEADADLARLETEESIHVKTGTRVTREFGKTAFGNWVWTNPGDTTEVFFTYRLPWRAAMDAHKKAAPEWQAVLLGGSRKPLSPYTLIVQKQSGTQASMRSAIIYPTDWRPVFLSDPSMQPAKNGVIHEFTLDVDKEFGVVMERQ